VTAAVVTSLAGAPSSASAVSAARPTTVAVAPDGTAYVGFADAPAVLVLSAAGVVTGSLALAGPVTALEVDPAGDLWTDDGTTVRRLAADGTVASSFPHRPAAGCDADAGRYGGLEVTSSVVYVAERCRGTVGVYTRTGALRATIDLPGAGAPRGVVTAPAYRSVPARLYVSVPGTGTVLGYDTDRLGAGAKPRVTIRLPRPNGYAAPEAAGVAADDRGHVAVLDRANGALHLYDARQRYGLFRTLGHPPTASPTKGYLDAPSAVVQGGPATGRHLWVADTGNGRVQRWSLAGTTQWMADAGTPTEPTPAEPAPVPTPDPTPVTTCRGEPAVTIDSGRRLARDPYVVLQVRAPEGAQEVEISNDGFRHVDRKPLDEGCRYPWTLAGGASRRAKVVSVRFPGVSGRAADRIVLDGTAPVIRRVTARWVTARQGWVLHVRAHDRGTGIERVLVGKTRAGARSWRWPADIVSWDSTQLRWIRVVDGAGNASRWYHLRL
jgi:hypothetical protein